MFISEWIIVQLRVESVEGERISVIDLNDETIIEQHYLILNYYGG